ncbi:MAG: Hpt domain-containing protein [Bdellovibrionaceae bacterium]|nr:Hpt domain-containing protein [Pseudobdellovibrionaceae bacterium]
MPNQEFKEKYTDQISVEQMLEDLIPNFLKNKRADLEILTQALREQDYEKVKKIGHNWKGACSSYGFIYLGEVGKQFEILAAHKDQEKLMTLITSLPKYLNNIKIDYICAPEDEERSLHK